MRAASTAIDIEVSARLGGTSRGPAPRDPPRIIAVCRNADRHDASCERRSAALELAHVNAERLGRPEEAIQAAELAVPGTAVLFVEEGDDVVAFGEAVRHRRLQSVPVHAALPRDRRHVEIVEAAARQVAIELDGNWHRQDIDYILEHVNKVLKRSDCSALSTL